MKTAIKAAAAQILGPIVRLMLSEGIGAREFQEIVRRGFVHAAIEMGKESVPPASSVSDVASLTGISRRDVAQILVSQASGDSDQAAGRHRAERVLNAWCHDPVFQDGKGNAARLAPKSFRMLVSKHTPDTRAGVIRRELERVKAVRLAADGKLEVVRRTYTPQALSADGIGEAGQQIFDHIQTLLHNLLHPRQPLYQRKIANRVLTPNQAAILERDIALHAEAVMNLLDGQLNDPPDDRTAGARSSTVRLGVGIHIFREPLEDESLDLRSASTNVINRGRRQKITDRKKRSAGKTITKR